MSQRLNALLNERGAIWDQMTGLRDTAADQTGDALTPEQRSEWDKLNKRMGEVTDEIEGLRGVGGTPRLPSQASEATSADGLREADKLHLGEKRMTDWVRENNLVPEEQRELSMQKFLRGAALGDWRDADPERRALAEGALATGGALVPASLSAEVIDLARNATQVIKAGARIAPMTTSTLTYPRLVSDPAIAWHTENSTISPSDPVFEQVTLHAQTLAGQVQLSRELLEDANGGDTEIAKIFALQFALKLDLAALYGSGTPPEPRGVKNATGITVQSMGTNGSTPSNYGFLVDSLGTLADNNYDPAKAAIIHSSRTWRSLSKLQDSTFQPMRPPDAVAAVPRLVSNQIGNAFTQGTASNASDVFVADWTNLVIGMRADLGIKVLDQRYADQGMIALLGWMRADVLVARPKAFVVVEGVLP